METGGVGSGRVGAHPSRGEQAGRRIGDLSHLHHAGTAEDLASQVVAVHGAEGGLRRCDGAVVVADDHDGGVLEAVVLGLRGDQRVGDRVDVHRLGALVEPADGVEVVDEGLIEDGAGSDAGGVGTEGARVAGDGVQALDLTHGARGDHLLGPRPRRREAAVESDLEDDAGVLRRPSGAPGVGHGGGQGLLGEDVLAGGGARLDELRVGGGRRRDDDGVDGGVRRGRQRVPAGGGRPVPDVELRGEPVEIGCGGVRQEGQPDAVDLLGDGASVVGADAPGSDEGDTFHESHSLVRVQVL